MRGASKRLSHPLVWVALLVGGAFLALLIVVLRGVGAVMQRLRRHGWDRERAARATWTRVITRVESAKRVTDAGDFSLLLAMPHGPHARVRTIVRVAPHVATAVEATERLPVLVHPQKPLVIALDFAEFLADATTADATAREDFALHGRRTWTSVE